jgi:hypothetical protein
MKNSYVKSVLGMVVLIIALAQSVNAQIHSTSTGGNWGDNSTWVGGGIPGATDDVVINGTVDCNANPSCNNILITSAGTIRNDYYSGSLTVNGNITNNGSIQNYTYGFTLYIKGDIVNNGNWSNYYTRPNGTADQTVSCLNGNNFSGNQFYNNKTSGNLYFNGTVNFDGCDVYLNNADVYLQANSTLNLHNGEFRNCTLYGSGSTSVVYAEGVYNVDATIIEYTDFNNLVLDGDVKFYAGCSTHGTVINNGFLQNAYYSTTSNFYDDFINNGTIRNYTYGFTINVYGNFTNNNVVDNYYLNFTSDTDQQISLMTGKTFSPNYFQSLKPTGAIIANTDLHFTDATIDMNYDSLFMQNNGTITLSNSYFTEGKIQALDAKSGYFTYNSENNSSTDYMTLSNATLTGEFQCGAHVYFRGTTTNNSLMHNDYYAATPELHDLFINNGTIQNEANGFTLNIYGDFINNNIVENSTLNFHSDADQFISLASGKQFTPTYFTSLKPAGKIIANTDLYFNNTIVDFNYDTLLLQNNGKLSLDDGYLTECYLLSTETKGGNLQLWMDNDANLDYCEVTNPEILGTTKIGPGNTFLGEILITDTLQNDYYSYTLNIDGNITNNGVIRNQPYGGGAFRLDISGNIVNNGIWQQSYSYLNGTTDQHVTCLNNSAFSGFRFYVTNTGWIYFDNEVRFENTEIKFEGNNLELPANSLLFIHDGFLENCNLHANGETSVLHGEGIYSADGPFMTYTTLENLRLTGDWGLASGITFNGTIINDGRIQNDYYAYSVVLNDNFINNGTIRNYSGGLTMKMYGNFTNNGNWAGHAIDLYGDVDQEISLADGSIFNPTYFTSFKPSGDILANTNLRFVNTIINLIDDSLVMQPSGVLSIDGQYLSGGHISPASGNFNLYMNNGANLNDVDIYDASLYGIVSCQTVNFYGTTTNYGIFQNEYYTYTVDVFGPLVNHGTIQNYSSSFILNCHSDITNNGTWTNYYTQMVGTSEQHIHLMNGHTIAGQMRLISEVQNGSYQWYWNTWAIVTQYPDPDYFTGYSNSSVLIFNNPVSSSWLGTFKCLSGGTWSRNIIVDEVSSMRLDLTAFLEGPYNGTGMNSDLNAIIPLQQSLGVIGYDGPEAVSAMPNTDIIDWIGVELREAADASLATEATTIGGGAFFIRNDGKIVGLDGSSMLSFDLTINQNLYVLLWHRNHLPIMTMTAVPQNGGIYTYDFTTSAGQAYGNNQSDLGGGAYGMIGGNANGDGIIDEFDGIEAWYPQVGTAGYLSSDVNMDGQVNNPDKNDIWLPNYGKSEIIP